MLTLITPESSLHKQKLFNSSKRTEMVQQKKTIKWSDNPTYDHVGVVEMSVRVERTKGKTMKDSFKDNFAHFISFTREKAFKEEGGIGLTIFPRDLNNKKTKHIYNKDYFREHSMGWESYFELENK